MGLREQQKVSYADYLSWDDHVRCEALDGQIISMSPSPTPKHQDVLRELTTEFGLFLRGKDCTVFASPIDVCLFANPETADNDIQDWVEPDLLVVCDPKKIGEKQIIGCPDLIVEVLSPSTAKNDRIFKFGKYEKAGVKEYWIVDPYNQSIEVYLHDGTALKHSGIFFRDETLPVNVLKDFQVDLANIFTEEAE
ncbi:MAG TPA: Uma2 family endonuclease [Bacillales bacterium]|nr:Uma2 family endonuclease [Bacillales bacterium]